VYTPELRQLRSFVAIAQAGTLTAAAAELHVAQQSLSQQLRVLEAQVGGALFQRSSRGVTLTMLGQALLDEARPLLAQADRLADTIARTARGERTELRVGFLPSVANYLMPPVVRAFRDHHPQIALRTEDVTIAQLVERVRDGRLDAGLSRQPLVDDLRAEEILREPVAAVLPEGHQLAARSELALSDLADESWVLTPRSSWAPWHRKYDEDYARAGYRPRVVQRADSPQSLLALVAAGVGVTRLPLSARSLRDTGVAFVPLAGDSAAVVLVTRPDAHGAAIDTLGEVVRDVAARLDPAAAG
jgi:DNA-binding transcriptional LysR family regulator